LGGVIFDELLVAIWMKPGGRFRILEVFLSEKGAQTLQVPSGYLLLVQLAG